MEPIVYNFQKIIITTCIKLDKIFREGKSKIKIIFTTYTTTKKSNKLNTHQNNKQFVKMFLSKF